MNGRPTKTDAEKIARRFAELQENGIARHDELAALIQENPRSHRYRTVVNVARRMFRDSSGGVELLAVRGVGYQVPTGSDQLRAGVGKLRSGVKTLKRAASIVGEIEDSRLDEKGRKDRDHTVQRVAYIHEVCKTERKALEATVGKVQPLPSMRVAQGQ